jgi:hypothetical protein
MKLPTRVFHRNESSSPRPPCRRRRWSSQQQPAAVLYLPQWWRTIQRIQPLPTRYILVLLLAGSVVLGWYTISSQGGSSVQSDVTITTTTTAVVGSTPPARKYDGRIQEYHHSPTTDIIQSVLYHSARVDRSGSVILDMLLAHAFAFRSNFTYGGACWKNSSSSSSSAMMRQRHERFIEAIGLSHVLQFACPGNNSNSSVTQRFMDSPTYTRGGTSLWTTEWLDYIRSQRLVYHGSQQIPTKPSVFSHRTRQIVVHIRRGDVALCNPETNNRYLPNSYYQKLLEEYVSTDADVTIYSERNSTESWNDFQQQQYTANAYNFKLDESPMEAWQAMIDADVLILSMSSFSIVPAMLNHHGRIVYTPFWVQPLPQWYVVDDDTVRAMQRSKLRLMSQLCSNEKIN